MWFGEERQALALSPEGCVVTDIPEDAAPVLRGLVGQTFYRIRTSGAEGGCSLHSVFGRPWAPQSNCLYLAQCKARYAASLGASDSDFKRLLGPDEWYYADLERLLWADLLQPVLRAALKLQLHGEQPRPAGTLL